MPGQYVLDFLQHSVMYLHQIPMHLRSKRFELIPIFGNVGRYFFIDRFVLMLEPGALQHIFPQGRHILGHLQISWTQLCHVLRHDLRHYVVQHHQIIYVPFGYASQQMCIHIMGDFRLRTLHIPGDVQIVVIFLDFLPAGQMAVPLFLCFGQVHIHNLGNIPFPQLIGLALLHETLGGINDLYGRIQFPILLQHHHAYRDAGIGE